MMRALTLSLAVLFAAPLKAEEKMSFEVIEELLLQAPPTLGLDGESYGKRRLVAAELDKVVNIAVNHQTSDDEFKRIKQLAKFYHGRVEAGLSTLEKTRVTTGVVICKFYSSSVVVKSAEGTIAIDFQEGPVRANGADPMDCDPISAKTGFLWSPEQLDRLANLVDASFISHIHPDHASFALTRRLVARGKPVVVTPELKELWRSLSHGLVVPDYHRPQVFGPAEVLATLGTQYMGKTGRDSEGREVGLRTELPGIDAETNVYLIKIGGQTIFHAAENNDVVDEWLSTAMKDGFKPTIILSTGMRQGGRATEAFLSRQIPFVRLPIHEYEMTHPGGGNRVSGAFKGKGKQELQSGRRAFLFWGEALVLPGAEKPTKSELQ